MSFQGKVVLVTGASSGIGASIAIKFAEQGANVTLVGRNQEKLNNVAEKCTEPLIEIADVSKTEDAKRIVEKTVKHFGQLDVLVNNAGIANAANITQDHAIEVFDKVIATNLRGPVLVTHFAIPHLMKTRGNIINISSVAALRVVAPQNFSYNTSKAGLDHFTRSIALELAPKGIRVNTVNPGPVKTDLIENMGVTKAEADADFEAFKQFTALKRISDAEEIADIVLFLASDKAKAITGSSFLTDNGLALKVAL